MVAGIRMAMQSEVRVGRYRSCLERQDHRSKGSRVGPFCYGWSRAGGDWEGEVCRALLPGGDWMGQERAGVREPHVKVASGVPVPAVAHPG